MKYRIKEIVTAEQWFPGKKIANVQDFKAEDRDCGLFAQNGSASLVKVGDWVITGSNGLMYTCKDEYFTKNFEKVEDQTPKPETKKRR
jgi:hypothetical protein